MCWNKIRDKITKHEHEIRIFFVIAVIVIYFVTFFYSLPSIVSGLSNIGQSGKPRTFQVPIYLYLTDYVGFGAPDISIILNITYPSGTLVIDDAVEISATAFLHQPTAYGSINLVKVGFQNSLEINSTNNQVTHNQWGETNQGALNFDQWSNIETSYTDANYNMFISQALTASDNVYVSWPIDGDYKPIIQWFYERGSVVAGNTSSTTVIYDEAVIHVYPKEQLTQIEANKVSIVLTTALFIFALVGVGTIALELWPENREKAERDEQLRRLIQKLLKQQEQHNKRPDRK